MSSQFEPRRPLIPGAAIAPPASTGIDHGATKNGKPGTVALRSRLRRSPPGAVVASVLAAMAFGLVPSGASARNLAADRCYHATLSNRLSWMTSGAPSFTGEPAVWIVDAATDELLRIDQHGWVESEPPGFPLDSRLTKPRQIRATASGYLVLDLEDSHHPAILRLDGALALEETFQVPTAVQAIYDFTPLGNGILAFGDLSLEEPITAFFHLDPQGELQVFYGYRPSDEVIYNYATDNTRRFLTSLGGVGYVLFLEERPHIGKVEVGVEGVRDLPFFPEDYRHFPSVAANPAWQKAAGSRGADQVRVFMEIVEESTMVTDLFAGRDESSDQGYLYLVAKGRNRGAEGTPFWLLKLDPESGREIARLSLPIRTSAAHLTIVPDYHNFWTVVERERVVELKSDRGLPAPYMRTGSMTLIPAVWLEDPGKVKSDRSMASCATLTLRQ